MGMSLISKKVQEFEGINGRSSMPHLNEKIKAEGKMLMLESEQTTATNTPQSGPPASSARASPAPKDDVKIEKNDESKEESKEKESKDGAEKEKPEKEVESTKTNDKEEKKVDDKDEKEDS